jgi:hypothetical protein
MQEIVSSSGWMGLVERPWASSTPARSMNPLQVPLDRSCAAWHCANLMCGNSRKSVLWL